MWICAVLYHKEPGASQMWRRMALTKCFHPLESEASAKTKEKSHTVSWDFSEAEFKKRDQRLLLRMMRRWDESRFFQTP